MYPYLAKLSQSRLLSIQVFTVNLWLRLESMQNTKFCKDNGSKGEGRVYLLGAKCAKHFPPAIPLTAQSKLALE